jgi:hypothetical protein
MIKPYSRAIALRRLSLCAAAAAWLALALPAAAQKPLQTLLVGIDHRSVVSLNGDWHYLVDQSPGRALYTSTGAINDKSYAMNDHPHIVGPHNKEYDFSAAPTLKVPCDWNTQVPQLFNYESVVWYQHQFVMLNKIPQLRGTTPWILMDFRSPTRNIPKLQDGYNRKGLISEDGKKKQAFQLFEQAYKNHTLGKPE